MRLAFAVALAVAVVAATLACSAPAEAVSGVDVSTYVSVSSFQCLRNEGYTFAIVRCYQSNGQLDPNCPATVRNAWSAGFSHVDIYMFPDVRANNAAAQVQSLKNYVDSQGIRIGQLWLDVESDGVYWPLGISGNRAFFQALWNEAAALGFNVGVYSSASQWSECFGSGYSNGHTNRVWYAHWDGARSFSDFGAFGGFNTPAMKQLSASGNSCGVSYDINWYA